MGITSPRTASATAVLLATIYIIFLFNSGRVNDPDTVRTINFIFLLLIGGLIGVASFSFAANEVKETEGLNYVLDLSVGKLIAIFLFSFFIGIGYDGLVLVVIEIIGSVSNAVTLDFSRTFMILIVGFLVIFPFFQFYFLAKPGEDSSIPAEYPLESLMERVASTLRSPFLAGLFAYGLLYVGPIIFMEQFLPDVNIFRSILLWALVLPLISLGALAGAGLGEDLIRLRLVRNIKDIPKLGLPKINLRKLQFDIGGLLIVLLAIQVLVATFFYGIQGIRVWLTPGIRDESILVGFIGPLGYLFLTLFNKGRGAFKELKEVWTESGFKVSVYQLFLPVFVFLGVILSSSLEVFIQGVASAPSETDLSGVLVDLGLDNHIRLASFFLVLQNFVLFFTAIYVFRNTPGTAERRLIKEVPDFYEGDLEGYRYIYDKLNDPKSIENLVVELTREIRREKGEIEFLKALLKETVEIDATNVKIAVAEAVSIIAKMEDSFDKDTYELTLKVLESEVLGAQIYGIRTLQILMKHLEGVEKEEAISHLQTYISHPDSVISWETSLILIRILSEEPQYRSFVLAKMITSLKETEEKDTIDSITRFFKKIAEDSQKIGQMAISILGVRLFSDELENTEKLALGIKALLRGNPRLVDDLIDQVSLGIDHPDVDQRKQTYLVLANMAEYGTGKEHDILQLILHGLDDDDEEVQRIAYEALTKEVSKTPELIDQVFQVIAQRFSELEGAPLIGALEVIEQIVRVSEDYYTRVFSLIENAATSSDPEVVQLVLKILADIAENQTVLSEQIYRAAEPILVHENENVRQDAVIAMGKIVSGNSHFASSVHRELSKSRRDESYIVQLAAIEAMGYVASASTQLSDEIFQSLLPLLEDDDWQVRLSALNGLFAAVKSQDRLVSDLVGVVCNTMLDPNRNIRLETLDITSWLMDHYRSAGEKIFETVDKNLGKGSDDEFITLLNTLEILADNHLLLIPKILSKLAQAYEKDDNNLRFAANEALQASLQRLQSSRNIPAETQKSLNKLVSRLMRAANNSNPKIRRSAYVALTEIAVHLPSLKVSSRCRTALVKSEKMEKDVVLLEFLEEARLRAKEPLDYDFGDRLNYE